jgi:hypothetical protein
MDFKVSFNNVWGTVGLGVGPLNSIDKMEWLKPLTMSTKGANKMFYNL